MQVFGNHKRAVGPMLVMLSAFIAVLMAACSTSQPTTTTSGSSNNSSTNSNIPIQFNTSLTHSPTGNANLVWNAENHQLTVNITLTGLAPNSTHPEHIHAGSCTSMPMGAIIYALHPVVADAHGVATTTSVINNVEHGIPEDGWYINVHNGPQLTSDLQSRAIACGNVSNANSSKDHNQSVQLQLTQTTAPDEAVHGNAQISLEQANLVVKVTLSGLIPNSTHIAHIHAGSCQAQGAVVYTLQPVVAGADGNATSTTVINNVHIFPTNSLYVNIHEAGSMAGMSTQSGFNPIACGNIASH